ncbi:hypothetical protein COCOBI_18-2190 [Coccomyxa sp. Obi]|nr:hypothetical protein COCOBI_18-2190 [Coccomyxa sp. Obi]
MTNLPGLSGIQLLPQLTSEAEAEGVDPQMLAAAIGSHQPTEAPAAAEHEAGDEQGESPEVAVPVSAAADSSTYQPERLSPLEDVALEQEEGVAWGAFRSADPGGEDAWRDCEEEYHIVGEYM